MYNLNHLIDCINNPNNYKDISTSKEYILSKILNKDESYRIDVKYFDSINFLTQEDKNLISKACNKWKNIILLRTKPHETYDMIISVYIETNDPNILASATCTSTYNGIPDKGSIWINSSNWRDQVKQEKDDGNTQAYYTILHELGHVFGIGTGVKWSNFIQDNMYTGEHALREYRNLLNNNSLIGIPIEDDGGGGTSGSHIEEGNEWTISKNNRYSDGHFHSGLDRELMTGWAESDTGVEPLSKVTVGFLQDVGFIVDYLKADNYKHDLTGILNENEKIKIEDKLITIHENKDHYIFYLHEHNVTINRNFVYISSESDSYLYCMYLSFNNDNNYYKKDIIIDNTKYNYINIKNLETPIQILNEYKGNKINSILFFFRNI